MTDLDDVQVLLDAATDGSGHRDAVQRICAVIPDLVGEVDEAGVCLIAGPNLRTVLASTSRFAERMDWLQFELGEGPCLLASQTGRLVTAPDLEGDPPADWPAYASRAVEAGVRAVHGFPVALGSSIGGAINLYRRSPGTLGPDATSVLHLVASSIRDALDADVVVLSPDQQVVHQATGALMAGSGSGLGAADALDLLRAYAFVHDRRLEDVARDVLARGLVLER